MSKLKRIMKMSKGVLFHSGGYGRGINSIDIVDINENISRSISKFYKIKI